MNMYHDLLIEHYRHSPYRGEIINPNFSSGYHNPSCGDTVHITGLLVNGVVERMMFQATGCVISQGTASLLCKKSCGQNVADLEQYGTYNIMAMIGMELGPNRLKCALLPLQALHKALADMDVLQTKKDECARSCQTLESIRAGS